MDDYVKSLDDKQVDNAIRAIEKLKLAGKNLSPEQVRYAIEIASKATNMGISPELAVSMAYHESGLSPHKTGDAGEIGIMQVLPGTAADMGFDSKELKKNPDQQIDAGLRYLKEQLVKTGNDPVMAVVAYNAGPDSQFFKTGELHPITEKYLDHVKSMGGFDGESSELTAPAKQPAPEGPIIDIPKVLEEKTNVQNGLEQRLKQDRDEQEIRQAQIYGGGAGALLGAKRYLGNQLSGFAENVTQKAIQGVLDAQQAASGNAPASLGGQPALSGPDISGSQPTGGKMAFNWGKAGGLGDIEAGRATAMGNAPGSADELIKARSDALKRLQTMAPATGMAEDPTRGAIMVPKQTPYTGPRGSQGEIGGAKPPPVSPVTPKPAGALEEVTSLLRRFANMPLMRYLGPAAGGALAFGDATRVAQELRKPNPDAGEIALSAAEGLGGLASIHPATAAVGIPVSAAAAAARFARERARENERLGYKPDVIPSNPMGDFGF